MPHENAPIRSSLRYRKSILAAAVVSFATLTFHETVAQQDDADATRTSPSANDASAGKKPRSRGHVKHAETAASSVPTEADAPPAPAKHICIIDHVAVDQRANVNVASNRRLAELRAAAQNEIDSNLRVENEQIKSVDQEMAQRPQDIALKQRHQALEEQSKRLALQANLYSREIEATRQLVTRQLQTSTTPLVKAVAKANSCSLLIARDIVVDSGDAVDVTQAVVEAMNGRLQFQPFGLVDLSGKNN